MKHITFKLLLTAGLLLASASTSVQASIFTKHRNTMNTAAVAVVETFLNKGKISNKKITAFARTISFGGVNNWFLSILSLIRSDYASRAARSELEQRYLILATLLLIRESYNYCPWLQRVFAKIGWDHLPEKLTMENLNWIGAAFFAKESAENLREALGLASVRPTLPTGENVERVVVYPE